KSSGFQALSPSRRPLVSWRGGSGHRRLPAYFCGLSVSEPGFEAVVALGWVRPGERLGHLAGLRRGEEGGGGPARTSPWAGRTERTWPALAPSPALGHQALRPCWSRQAEPQSSSKCGRRPTCGNKRRCRLRLGVNGDPLSSAAGPGPAPWESATRLGARHGEGAALDEVAGKIEELLPVSSIDAETRLVLVNAIYFKGKWNEWFDETYTREMPFKINQEEQRPVQMMYQEAFFMLAHVGEVGAQLLELPYAGEELSLLVLLPDDGVELSTVEKNLTFEKLTAWTKPDCMKSTEVEVHLPKFKLQEDYDMASVLPRLGMVDAFQRGKADLSAMSAERDLCLSKFVHKTFVEVNEEGTEAVAASDMLVEAECGKESGLRFCADHPFLFFIRHNRANNLLFCGRFSSP
uniref:Serpin family B member 9 n=2 Tax=Callithrix jacchus TaxID=9483 RepID=A0A2R8MAX9_CALJA